MLGKVLITDWVIYAVTVKPVKVFFTYLKQISSFA